MTLGSIVKFLASLVLIYAWTTKIHSIHISLTHILLFLLSIFYCFLYVWKKLLTIVKKNDTFELFELSDW